MSQINVMRRVDQWLFFSRLTKSRSLAGRLVTSGKVRLNKEKLVKPSQTVKVGDVITAMINNRVRIIRVEALGTRRGPASEAQLLYTDLTPEEKKSDKGRLMVANSPSRPKGMGRPTKKDRRRIDSLKSYTS